MKSYRARFARDEVFPLRMTTERIEVQERPHGRWQEWLGPFEENWMPGVGTLYIDKRYTQLVDRRGHTVGVGRTRDSVAS